MSDKVLQNTDDLKQALRRSIINFVNERGPVTAVETAAHTTHEVVTGKYGVFAVPVNNCMDDFPAILDECVAAHEIIEFEYVLPNMAYRIKSLLFPKGSTMKKWTGKIG